MTAVQFNASRSYACAASLKGTGQVAETVAFLAAHKSYLGVFPVRLADMYSVGSVYITQYIYITQSFSFGPDSQTIVIFGPNRWLCPAAARSAADSFGRYKIFSRGSADCDQ